MIFYLVLLLFKSTADHFKKNNIISKTIKCCISDPIKNMFFFAFSVVLIRMLSNKYLALQEVFPS